MFFRLALALMAGLPLTAAAKTGRVDNPPEPAAGDTAAAGAREPAPPVAPPPPQPSTPPDGMWPSPKLMRSLLARWADEVGTQYELDDTQRAKLREAVERRWGTFLGENRSTIQPVVSEFIEMRMDVEPPGKEQVQAWAERALPVFERVREQFNGGTGEFREILHPRQRVKFELDALQFGVGLELAHQKLRLWQTGECNTDEFWEPTPSVRRQRGDRRRHQHVDPDEPTAAAPTEPKETDQIVIELHAWDAYVQEFIRVFNLDEGQRTAVLSILSELRSRAVGHRDRHKLEIAELEQRIAAFTGSDEEAAELKKRLTDLYGPIDEMFQELKRRIECIPTTTQRIEAGAGQETSKRQDVETPESEPRP